MRDDTDAPKNKLEGQDQNHQDSPAKPHYEPPVVMPLGEVTMGYGKACVPGGGASSNCLEGSGAAGNHCRSGSGASSGRCRHGSAAGSGCISGDSAGLS